MPDKASKTSIRITFVEDVVRDGEDLFIAETEDSENVLRLRFRFLTVEIKFKVFIILSIFCELWSVEKPFKALSNITSFDGAFSAAVLLSSITEWSLLIYFLFKIF